VWLTLCLTVLLWCGAAMAIRNLTTHFVRARSEAQRRRPALPLNHFGEASDSSTAPLKAFDEHQHTSTDAIAPAYVDTVEEINREIAEIQRKSA
jgi:hypothetical protein